MKKIQPSGRRGPSAAAVAIVAASIFVAAVAIVVASMLVAATANAHEPHVCPDGLPATPGLPGHVEQHEIDSRTRSLDEILEAGRRLFTGPVNTCDGFGRPAATGAGERRTPDQPEMIRTSSPEATACASCHSQPVTGGAGDFVTNVFVLAEGLDPATDSVSPLLSNERNSLGLFGAGAIELLAREMSADLRAQATGLPDGEHTLTTKGVDFEVTIAGGTVTASRGVDADLIVKPFHQAGVVVSLREFAVNAFNHHLGLQAEERFDLNPAKGFDPDFDADGIARELTVGDITAVTLWQASLPIPRQLKPTGPTARRALALGERVFAEVGCTTCHRPALILESTVFVEPNPDNPPGTCRDAALCPAFRLDLADDDAGAPRLERLPGGRAIVRAYTDLKRHNLCDAESAPNPIRHYCNEHLPQGRPDQDGRPGAEFFLTRKLWDAGNSSPYGHRGDLTTLAEAILVHGGEARAARDAFAARPLEEQRALIEFLESLQMPPLDAHGAHGRRGEDHGRYAEWPTGFHSRSK